MSTRYFDNAATSFPKPPEVPRAMLAAMEIGASGRGVYGPAREMARLVNACREKIARLVNMRPMSPENVVFGYNTTDGLNLAVKGVLGHARRTRGPQTRLHIVLTEMEHNSILRPINTLMERDTKIECTRVGADPESGLIDPSALRAAIRTNETVLVCINHASNVTGTVQDMAALGNVCAEFGAGSGEPDGVLLLVDGAQSLGHIPVDITAMHADLLAFPGHKGLLGPQGTGGLVIRPGVERQLDTVREGGTGSVSEQEAHPAMMPEKYEPGSHNAVGIAGLGAAVAWLLDRGIDRLREHEIGLMRRMLDGISEERTPGLRLVGPREVERRVGVFSFVHETLSAAEIAAILEAEYGVLTRAGLHCAPLAHKAFGTAGGGAVRLSFGPFMEVADVDFALDALSAVCREARAGV